ncbi:carboxylate-amine ligase [Actinokineospora bangkokensis]|uniref:Putative glutamate--cysteine ligase 2 n=1 Tax=Actinokineospora bangkokensis TaxID=1193682 RepID=A0A1Q9LMR4_9PSEU|nr:YbdK family carboxylate-amine ligase [Actinokineospora bangkokensis]OLR93320.1 hypothetical protein BJP25_17755 [Actinokineospora bangkokensis]
MTMGVEEEFLLVDPDTGRPAAAVDDVLARVGALPPGGAVHRELRASQVEVTTGVCTTAAELRGQLAAGRRAVAEAARAAGVLAVPVGTPPLAGNTGGVPVLGPGDRYARIDELYGEVTRDYEACGLHVHVGVPDGDTAVAVVNHVNRWLPTLLALAVNSPLHAGRDTGYGSWRVVQQSLFPGSGLAPHAADHAAWKAGVARLVDCGVLADEGQTFWFARPSPHVPTVEFRAADTAVDVDDAVLQALLCRALTRTALAEVDSGREAPVLPRDLAPAAVWSAARYGTTGPGIDLVAGRQVPARQLVGDLLDHVRDALVDTGDLAQVEGLLDRASGAQQQRHVVAVAGIEAVPGALALRTG